MTLATNPNSQVALGHEALLKATAGLRAQVKTELDEVEFDVAPADYRALCERVHAAGFDYPRCLSGSDMEYGLRVTLHLQQLETRRKITIRTDLPYDAQGNASIESVSDLWGGVEWHEREAYDLLGITFTGHPDHRRILLEEHWSIHPLQRKYSTRGYLNPAWSAKAFPSPAPFEEGFMPFGVASTPIPVRAPVGSRPEPKPAAVATAPATPAPALVVEAAAPAPAAAPSAPAAVAPAEDKPRSPKIKRWVPKN